MQCIDANPHDMIQYNTIQYSHLCGPLILFNGIKLLSACYLCAITTVFTTVVIQHCGAGTGEWHRHGRAAPARENGRGALAWESGAGTGEWRRHGRVAPARESGAGTGEWRRHKTWMATADFV